MAQKIGTIGLKQISGCINFMLASAESMTDFKMFVWKPGAKDELWEWAGRQADFAQFFDRGGLLILFLERGSEFRYALPPDFPIFSQKLTGFSLEIPDSPIGRILAPYFDQKPKYSVVLNIIKGSFTPIATTPGNQKIISLWANYRNGFVCALPYDGEKEGIIPTLIPRLDNFFSKQTKTIEIKLGELPYWTTKYEFLEKQRATNEKQELEQKLLEIQREIPKLDQSIKSFDKYMYLFTEEGKTLDRLIRGIFSEIGFTIEDGPDLNSYGVISYQKYKGIIITKALKIQLTEKDGRQVEVWKSHYESYSNTLPKGILIANAFYDIDVIERNQNPFSQELLSYAQATQICLLSTIQLIGIIMELKGHIQNRDRIIDEIFQANGTMRGYQEPHKYLVKKINNGE